MSGRKCGAQLVNGGTCTRKVGEGKQGCFQHPNGSATVMRTMNDYKNLVKTSASKDFQGNDSPNNEELPTREDVVKQSKREFSKVVGEMFRLSKHENMGSSITDECVSLLYRSYELGMEGTDEAEEEYEGLILDLRGYRTVGDIGSFEYEQVYDWMNQLHTHGEDTQELLDNLPS